MITAVIVGYYLFAFGLIYAVAYLTYRRNGRELQRQMDEIAARVQESKAEFPPLPPYVLEPIPDDEEPAPDDEYADTIASVREQLAELADHGYPVAAALKEVTALARRVGV